MDPARRSNDCDRRSKPGFGRARTAVGAQQLPRRQRRGDLQRADHAQRSAAARDVRPCVPPDLPRCDRGGRQYRRGAPPHRARKRGLGIDRAGPREPRSRLRGAGERGDPRAGYRAQPDLPRPHQRGRIPALSLPRGRYRLSGRGVGRVRSCAAPGAGERRHRSYGGGRDSRGDDAGRGRRRFRAGPGRTSGFHGRARRRIFPQQRRELRRIGRVLRCGERPRNPAIDSRCGNASQSGAPAVEPRQRCGSRALFRPRQWGAGPARRGGSAADPQLPGDPGAQPERLARGASGAGGAGDPASPNDR